MSQKERRSKSTDSLVRMQFLHPRFIKRSDWNEKIKFKT